MKKLLLASLAAVLAAVVGTQVYSQTQTTPPPGGVIAIACTYQSNEANAAIITGRYGLAQCDNRGYLKVTPSGGGGGGGAVTIADGADATQGAIADAAASAGGTGTVSAKLRLMTTLLNTISTNVASSIPAGTNAIGDVGLYPRASNMTVTPVSFSSAGNNTIVVRSVGTIKLYKLVLSCASSTNLTLMNGTSVSASGIMPATSVFLPFDTQPHVTTTSTNNFVINQPTAVACGGFASYLDN